MMNIFDFFRMRDKSASTAKERLQIVISHQRLEDTVQHEFLPKLRQELIEVVRRYIEVDDLDDIQVQLQKQGNCSILELNVTLPPEAMN